MRLLLAALLAAGGAGQPALSADRPWPFNGQVTNGWDRPLEAWSDSRGTFAVDPGTRTGFAEDVDYVNVDGQWYKIGAHHTRVDPDG
ncbi:MAG: hypothetical protein ACFCVH_20590, partial [Alphaproteobacteria bacterium]